MKNKIVIDKQKLLDLLHRDGLNTYDHADDHILVTGFEDKSSYILPYI